MQNGIQGVILACILTLSLAACGQEQFEPPPPTVGIVTLATGSTELANELPGRIAARETADVRPQISGVIRRRLFEEGSFVRAGQVLYEIEDAPYRAAVAQAQGALAVARATINSTASQGRVRQGGVISAVAVGHRQAALAVMCRG